MSRNFILFVSVLVLASQQVYSQDACKRITTDDLGNSEMFFAGDDLLTSILTPGGESTEGVMVKILNTTIVCEAQHMMQDRYRYTSVVVSFNCMFTDTRVPECNDSSVVHTEQYDFGCVGGEWSRNILTVSDKARTANPIATLDTGLDRSCIVCANPTNGEAARLPATIDTVQHCLECANCPDGLQRCYYQQGTFNEECCNYFHNGLCVVRCPPNYAPNNQFECEIQCPVLNATNGIVTYPNGRFVGSVATLTCNEGYETTNTQVTCMTGRMWSVADPECTRISCHDVVPDDEKVRISYLDGNKFVGSRVEYTCESRSYYYDGNPEGVCMASRSWVPGPSTCESCALAIPDCVQCEVDKDKSDEPICTMCKEGFILEDGKCTTSSPVAPQASSCDVPCIIGIVLAILAVIIIGTVVAVVAFVLYKYLNDPATKLAKTDTGGLNGVARDNPLYVDPAAVTDEGLDGVATETTPLEA